MNKDRFSTTPTSIEDPLPIRPWAELTFDCLDLFTSYFPDDHSLLTTNFLTSTSRSRLFIRHIISKKYRDRKNSFKTEQQLHLQTMLPFDSLLWSKITSEVIKLHYTHGRPFRFDIVGDSVWHVYSSVAATRNLKNPSFTIGLLGRLPASFNFLDIRIRCNAGEFINEKYLYCKGGLEWKGLNLGVLASIDINRHLLQKNDLKLGLKLGQIGWIGAQLQVDNFRNYKINSYRLGSYFDILRLSYIHRFHGNKWVSGLQYEYNLENSELKKFEAVIQHRPGENGLTHLKARINSNLEIALAGRYSLSQEKRWEWGLCWGKAMRWQPTNFSFLLSIGRQ